MTDLVIPPGYVNLTYTLTHATIQHAALFSIGGKVEGAPFTQANADSCLAQAVTSLASLWDNEVTFGRVVASVGNDGPLIRYESIGTGVGTATTRTTLPPAVSVVVRKVTGFGGRQYRGRMYLPFPATVDFGQGGQWVSGRQTVWQTAAATFGAALISVAGNNLSELSLLHSPPMVGSTPLPTPITALLATNFCGTQRRRQQRV